MSVQYRNWLSRVLVKPFFERQTLDPQQPSWLNKPVGLFEKCFMRIKSAEIQVDRPIFLIGNARSGSTMLQDILCSHPDMAYFTNTMNEFPSCFCAAETLRKFLCLDVGGERFQKDSVSVSAGSASEGTDLWRSVLRPGAEITTEIKAYRKSELEESQITEIHNLIRRALWCFGARPNGDGNQKGERFFNKNMTFRMLAPLWQELYPDARFIHLIRDPRQVANSIVKMNRLAKEHQENRKFEEESSDDDALQRHAIREASHYWNSMTTFVQEFKTVANHIHEVKYEDILDNPIDRLEEIRTFCELSPVNDKEHVYWQKINHIGDLQHSNTYGNFHLIASVCWKQMREYGYLKKPDEESSLPAGES